MAPGTNYRRVILTFSLLLLSSATLLPLSVSAAPLAESPALPDLASFALAVQNGDGSSLRGVYVENIFADPVVPQPGSNAGFVSTVADTLTQFEPASQYGNTGLLAHNYLAGQYFPGLVPGQRIQLIYGDGRIEYFMVTRLYRYQATSPDSTYSDFIDLDSGEYLSASGLFAKVYMGERHVTFQTCIAANGDPSWGRLFVIAEPEIPVDLPGNAQ